MLVVSDIDDVFLPKPTDLLVNLAESRASLESLLGRVGEMFQDNTVIGSALGPALQAGFKLMVRWFGREGSDEADFFYLYGFRHRLEGKLSFCRPASHHTAPELSKIEKIPRSLVLPRLLPFLKFMLL